MNRSVARLITLLTSSLVLCVGATSANAIHSAPVGAFGAVDGTTAFVQDNETEITARDLATGVTTRFPLPAGYPAVWNDKPIAGHGRFAGATDSNGSVRIFETGPAGITYFTSPWRWTLDSSSCSSRQQPLGIRADGSVMILDLAQSYDAKAHACAIDLANTRLRLYDPSGGIKELWFPEKYMKWLARGSVSLRGNQLLVSRPGWDPGGGRFAVLNISARQVIYEVAAGKQFSRAELTARHGALAHYGNHRRISARHFSLYSKHSWLVYRGKNDRQIYACGQRTVIGGAGFVTLRGLHGTLLDRKARKGDYAESSVMCSDRVVLYNLNPNLPASGEAPGDLPPLVRGLFDLSKYRL